MSLHYDLNLAIAFACALAILNWAAFWLFPLALRAIAAAIREVSRSLRARLQHGDPPGGAHAQQVHEQPWWGPHSAS